MELDAPRFETFDQFRETVDRSVSEPTLGHPRLIFFDEAHSIGRLRNGYDFLLKLVEEPPPGIVFCFATTEFDRISKALRSRLFKIEIRPWGLDRGITFLRDIANKERIQPEPEDEALALLVGLGQGLPRDMLQALDQVREVGDVTRERVRAHFGIDQSEKLVDYFMALAEGDFARQTQVISTWNEDLKKQVRLVQLFLLSLYYNNLLTIHLILDPMVASITDLERQPILQAFRARLDVSHSDLLPFWQRMIELLPIVSSDESEEALRIRLTMFQRFVTDAPRGMAQPQNFSQASAVPVPQNSTPEIRPVPKRPGPKHRRRRGPAPIQNPAYLSFDVVRDLFNAASFLLQHYGSFCFNTQITIPYRLFKLNNEKEESQFLSDFYRELLYYFRRSFACEFHRLSVLEHNDKLGLCARVIIHVPNEPAKVELLKKWLCDWRADQRIKARGELEIRPDIKPFSSTAPMVSRHWQCVRWLCAGLDPNDERLHTLDLKRTPRRTAGIIGERRRFSRSASLSPKRIEEAVQYQLEFLLPFDDDEAWTHLEDGWELHEHSDRREQLEQRKKEVAEIEAKFPKGKSKATDAKRESALTNLKNCWPATYERPRSWPVWWRNEQI
jgi:DNA polymerase III delta prime subunit